MTGDVDWQTLVAMVAVAIFSSGTVGGILLRIFKYQYSKDKAHADELHDIRQEFHNLKLEIANTYLSLKAMEMIKSGMDTRSDHLDNAIRELGNRLTTSVDRLTDKQDKIFTDLLHAITKQNHSAL